MILRKISIFTLVSIIFILMLSACSAPTGQSSNKVDGDSNSANSTKNSDSNSPDSEIVTLTMWDNYTDESISNAFDEMIKDFEGNNPGIKVKRTTMSVDNIRSTIKPALTSGEGPDLFNYDAGPGYLGVLASSGLALDLTGYADQYGWNERFPEWINERVTFDGKMYGIGHEVELIGVYYNKKIFKELGVDVPKTYDEFLAICEQAKQNGLVAISFDDKDQWPAFHLESVFYTAVAGKDKITKVLNQEETFNQPIFAEALDEFYALIEKGYVSSNPLAVSYDDGNKEFFSGKAAMRITGTWMVGEMVENLKEDVGFFLMPSIDPNLPLMAPGGIGGAMVASGTTKHPDETAKFLDFMYSEEVAPIWYENSKIAPIDVDVDTLEVSGLFKDVVRMANTPAGLSYNIDVLMPQKVNTVTMNVLQELIAGKKTGTEVVEAKQKAFDEEIAAGNY
jgi:raffinose/stachyose/melibiose transport system substrate-binding protein